MPFHFHGAPPPGYGDAIVYSPDVLRHFANEVRVVADDRALVVEAQETLAVLRDRSASR